ncbi:MAG: Iojap protein [Polyangiaceae bacterium]|jgi:ribosome-associated protein|nr:Iojap protein [Polyangiaceae bacterium]
MKKKLKALKRPIRVATKPTPLRAATKPVRDSSDAQRMALAAAAAGLDKKAMGVEIIDVAGKVDYADYLVLMTGHADRHVAAIADAVDEALGKQGYHAISIEGLPRGQWVLIDFVDIVVHVFLAETRALYDLDGLWMDAKRVRVPGT